jgi:hemolysin activation/secretion protein
VRGAVLSRPLLAGLLVLAFSDDAVRAQPAIERPEETRPVLPPFLPPVEPPPEPAPLPPPAPEAPLSEGERVLVQGIRFSGNTVIADEELLAVAGPWLGRELAVEELLRLRDALTRAYVDRGYINSGAVIPDQTVTDGVLEIVIVEGRLDEIRLFGLESLEPAFVAARLRQGIGPPLNIEELRERIQLLLTDPAIERLDARLGPGVRPGEGRLDVDLVEAPRYPVEVRLANDRSPSVGSLRGEMAVTFGNILGYSDPLRVALGVSEGLRDIEAGYSVPVTVDDLRLFGVVSYTRSNVVEEPFSVIDVESRSRALELGLSWPWLRTLDRELRLDLSLENQRSTTFLLGRPFPFSPGVEPDGQSNVTTLKAAATWQQRSEVEVVALRSQFTFRLDLLGATVNPGDLPDGRFFAWLGQGQYARRLTEGGWQVNLRADLQLTPDPLLPIQRIAIGGGDTVRGYRENQIVRDNGWDASVELRIPLPDLRLPGISLEPGEGALQLVPFVDAGGGWNNRAATPAPEVIWSVGAGLRWQPVAQLAARLDVGVPLRDAPAPDQRSLQDHGIHFRITAALY